MHSLIWPMGRLYFAPDQILLPEYDEKVICWTAFCDRPDERSDRPLRMRHFNVSLHPPWRQSCTVNASATSGPAVSTRTRNAHSITSRWTSSSSIQHRVRIPCGGNSARCFLQARADQRPLQEPCGECGVNCARRDLCGGRGAIRVPTATQRSSYPFTGRPAQVTWTDISGKQAGRVGGLPFRLECHQRCVDTLFAHANFSM